jgi:hypothetical protein
MTEVRDATEAEQLFAALGGAGGGGDGTPGDDAR